MLLLPCDAPFLPTDLATRLRRQARSGRVSIAVARDASGLQPAFSLWHCSVLAEVDQAVSDGLAGFHQFLRGRSFAEVVWPDGDTESFFNINDREALEMAHRIAAGRTGPKT
jgi:molybdopterin-guanine dinucleotide biosynthesis protein A